MTLYADGILLPEGTPVPDKADCLLAVAQPAQRAAALGALLPAAAEAGHMDCRHAARYESHNGFDYICLGVPDLAQPLNQPAWVEIFLTERVLLVVGEAVPPVQGLLEIWNKGENAPHSPDRALYVFFAQLMQGDTEALDDLEEEIAALEDNILSRAKDAPAQGYVPLIGGLRKRLLALKRYYEALWALLQDLEENQNGFISKQQLRYFGFHTNRAERLSRAVLNLRDYVTQVRESYQNQLDINLNQIMKLFTVITAVFLPLTLITGWFGMNLIMPETAYAITYPLVMLLCLAVAAGCLWYFKRHKWF